MTKMESIKKLFWINAMMAYEDGEIGLLEELIRTEGVPIEMANEIADILIGKTKPRKLKYHEKQFNELYAYMQMTKLIQPLLREKMPELIKIYPELAKIRWKVKTPKSIELQFKKAFAKKCYDNNTESGRKTWDRLEKKIK